MISVIINVSVSDQEKDFERCLKSVKWADEIVVVDMHTSYSAIKRARESGAKIYLHEHVRFIEPVRNFAIGKATGDWILILDPDEEIPAPLSGKLREIAESPVGDYYSLPRKNIIFGKWIKHSRWWPDYNIRFFKRGSVVWSDKIHSVPITSGVGVDLQADEEIAIVHHHYQTISQFVERMNRYTGVQAADLIDSGYNFRWQDLIDKPVSEFLGRFFAGEGYKDGLHGLALAVLQGISQFVLYLKVWENNKFVQQEIKDYPKIINKNINEYYHWQAKISGLCAKIRLKLKSKV